MLVRDPVHGDIVLDAVQAAVLDRPEVQRLRGIKQLGLAYLVYPGALHTRFDHSLGVCAMTQRIVASLRAQGAEVADELARAIGIAALLHDATHVPFGHTFEDERRLFPRHDKGSRLGWLLEAGLGEALMHAGVEPLVSELLGARPRRNVPAWACQVVASTIDADLLDYLKRDAYFAGLAPRYDERVFRYFTIHDQQLCLALTRHGMERADAYSETVQVLRLRYFLTERVYYHHTKVAAGAMVSKAVELALAHGQLGERELLSLTDAQLFQRLRSIPTAAHPDPAIVGLVDRLEQRRLLKRGYVLSAQALAREERARFVQRYHENAQERRAAEESLARAIGCPPAEVVVYCPALTVMKEARALARTAAGVLPLEDYDRSGEIRALQARYEELWRFYVFVPEVHRAAAAAAAAELFGYPSELR
jgi:HD superfamily phosphohydrolase